MGQRGNKDEKKERGEKRKGRTEERKGGAVVGQAHVGESQPVNLSCHSVSLRAQQEGGNYTPAQCPGLGTEAGHCRGQKLC